MKSLAVRYSLPLLITATLIGIASPAGAITLGQIDTFQDGGLANWTVDAGNVTFTNVADAGPLGAGDNVLDAECNVRFVFFNKTQWTGNYTAAGVTKISMDVRHENAFPLELRLGIAKGVIRSGGTGDTYVTDYSITVPNDGQWRRITFDVTADDFIPGAGNPPSPPPNVAVALTGVTQLRILHNTTLGDFLGESNPGSMRVNNILAEGDAAEDADFDGDDDVDGNDFLIWQRGLGVGTTQTGDADGNGSVNALDLAVWKAQYGVPATPAATPIPEPASVAVAALAVLAGALRQRRRRR